MPYNYTGKLALTRAFSYEILYDITTDYRVSPAAVTYTPSTVAVTGTNINWKRYTECSCPNYPNWCWSFCSNNQIIYNSIPAYNSGIASRTSIQLETLIDAPVVSTNYSLNITYKRTTIRSTGTTTSTNTFTSSILVKPNSLIIKHYNITNEASPLNNLKILDETNSFVYNSNDTNKHLFSISNDGSESSIFEFTSESEDYDLSNANIDGLGLIFTVIERSRYKLKVKAKHPKYNYDFTKAQNIIVNFYNFYNSIDYYFDVQVKRTPVLFVHGLCSNATAFSKMMNTIALNSNEEYQNFQFLSVDYSSSSASGFYSNNHVIPNGINTLLEQVRNVKIAVGKVDVIGHSMGGILTRLYQQNINFKKDIGRIITINTPHSGSPWPEVLSDGAWKRVSGFLCDDDNNSNFLAIPDLSVNNPIIDSDLNGPSRLINKEIPSFSITTTKELYSAEIPITVDFVARRYPIATALIVLNDATTSMNNLFEYKAHDYVVSKESQVGGLSKTANILEQWHMNSVSNNDVINKVHFLLKSPLSEFSILGFNPPNLTYPPVGALSLTNNNTGTTPTIAITLLLNNSTYKNGDIVTVNILGENLSEITAMTEYSADSILAIRTNGNALSFNFRINNTFFRGFHDFTVIGKDENGNTVKKNIKYVVSSSNNSCQFSTVNSGYWQDPNIWSCGSVPTVLDDVILNAGHIVTVDGITVQANKVIYSGGRIVTFNNGKLQLKH